MKKCRKSAIIKASNLFLEVPYAAFNSLGNLEPCVDLHEQSADYSRHDWLQKHLGHNHRLRSKLLCSMVPAEAQCTAAHRTGVSHRHLHPELQRGFHAKLWNGNPAFGVDPENQNRQVTSIPKKREVTTPLVSHVYKKDLP